MTKKSHYPTLLFMTIILFMLSNCSTINRPQTGNPIVENPYTESADVYLAKAESVDGEEKNQLKIQAAGKLIFDRQIQDGVKLLKQTRTKDTVNADEKRLLLAKANMMVDNTNRAKIYLSQIRENDVLQPFYQSLYRQLLIDSFERKGQALPAIEERIKYQQQLTSLSEKRHNYDKIWQDFLKLPLPELQTLTIETTNPVIKGWASLALIVSRKDVFSAIEQWQSTFPDHEANLLLSQNQIKSLPSGQAKNVALLLPLSGHLAGPGKAIRDGFIDAKSQTHQATQFRLYDTAKEPPATLYQRAIADGAQMIIGPITKENVAIIAQQPHPVPTLLLNYTDGPIRNNAWQFGLSPEHEIYGLVAKLNRDGFQHPIVIAPKGRWGEQVLSLFKQAWQQSGQAITDEMIVSKQTNYNQAIRHLLHIDDSALREKQLKRVVGRDVKGNLRRRQDFDSVIILTHSSKARQIVPLLKYYYLGDTPVFALSSIHAADLGVAQNRDLDGVVFPDLAYIFQQDKLVARNWPEKLNSYNRLFAIGRDSYYLSQNLSKVLAFPSITLGQLDDEVFLSKPGHIAYQLQWGKFVEGMAQRSA